VILSFVFLIDYVMSIIDSLDVTAYLFSFYGIVDLFSILPGIVFLVDLQHLSTTSKHPGIKFMLSLGIFRYVRERVGIALCISACMHGSSIPRGAVYLPKLVPSLIISAQVV